MNSTAFDVDSIMAIHRDPDGFIAFTRKPDPAQPARLDRNGRPYTWDDLFSIRAADLRGMFPALADWLVTDSYMGVNAFYRAAPWKSAVTGLPGVWRKEKHLRSLTACYTDIDCGRPESDEPGAALSYRVALYRAGVLADSGIIPQPSIMARSGRGCYLFFLLHDEQEQARPPRAWPEKILLYKTINRALNERLRANRLPADLRAIDAARVLRVPGSIHRKTGRRVFYTIQADRHGHGFSYTLTDLAAALDIQATGGELPTATAVAARLTPRPRQHRKTQAKGSAPLRGRGVVALNAKRAADLRTLEQHHGGWLKRGGKYPDGHVSPGRRFMVNLYANFLHGSGAADSEAIAALTAMAANCKPAWPDEPGDPTPTDLWTGAAPDGKRPRWSNLKLCALLGITHELAAALELQTIVPDSLTAERKAARPRATDAIQERRDFARQYIEINGPVTARGLANIYRQKGLKGANPQTANTDLTALGLKPIHGQRRRGLDTTPELKGGES